MGMFKPAIKSESKLRLAIAGPSGSGKTYTSLAIATALANGKPIAVVDTENGSAAKYAGIFTFDVAEMHAPYHPDKYITALQEAAAAGYGVIVLDSMTHAWAGTGGVLDLVDEAAKRSKSGNTYMAWKEGTPVQNRLIEAIVASPLHVIATVRSKTEYVMQTNSNGKQEPKKVGMAPEQRNGFEYEFDVFFDMDIDNNAIVSKTRCPALTGRVFSKPGRDVASILAEWLRGEPAPQPPTRQEVITTTTTPAGAAAATNGTATGNASANGNGSTNGHGGQLWQTWQGADDAKAWAVECGAQPNEFAARNSLAKIVNDRFGGKLTTANRDDVFAAYYERQMQHLHEQANAVVEDAQEMVPA